MESLFAFSPLVIGAIPLALGLVAAIKLTGLPKEYAPLLSIVIGICLVALTGIAWQAMIAQGIIIGLASSGLWSGSKNVVMAFSPKK